MPYRNLSQTPAYICEINKLQNNLELLAKIQNATGAKILLALKGFALWSTFDLCKQYLPGCCASGLHEAKLAHEKFGGEVHTYSPAFKQSEIETIIALSHHIVFNSFAQLEKFRPLAIGKTSIGLRVNPESSNIGVDLYNPCAPFSRLGITQKEFRDDLLDGVEGLHFHALCEQNVDALQNVLQSFESKFGAFLPKMKWVNFGGGHHITRIDYDVNGLIELLQNFSKRHPNLQIYLEPGEAIGWQTGVLVASVLDIVHNEIDIAILDTSAEAHMPDTLAMPYRPNVRNSDFANHKKHTYRLAGNTCLAGDIIGDYSFDAPLQVGQKIIFEDMIHYTMVKNTTFNGINLPNIVLKHSDGRLEVIKDFGYEDYKMRLS